MANPILDPNAPAFTRRYMNLADPRLGAKGEGGARGMWRTHPPIAERLARLASLGYAPGSERRQD